MRRPGCAQPFGSRRRTLREFLGWPPGEAPRGPTAHRGFRPSASRANRLPRPTRRTWRSASSRWRRSTTASIASVGILQVVTGHPSVFIFVHDDPHPVGHGGLVDPVQVCHRDAYRYQHRCVVADTVNAFQRSTVDHRLGVRVGVPEQGLDVLYVVVRTEHAVQGPTGSLDESRDALVDVVLFVAEHIHHCLGGGVDEALDADTVSIGLTLLIY